MRQSEALNPETGPAIYSELHRLTATETALETDVQKWVGAPFAAAASCTAHVTVPRWALPDMRPRDT